MRGEDEVEKHGKESNCRYFAFHFCPDFLFVVKWVFFAISKKIAGCNSKKKSKSRAAAALKEIVSS